MTRITNEVLHSDMGYIKEKVTCIEGHLEKLNGTVQKNCMDIQRGKDTIKVHLENHKNERNEKYKLVAAITSIMTVLISIMYFIKA